MASDEWRKRKEEERITAECAEGPETARVKLGWGAHGGEEPAEIIRGGEERWTRMVKRERRRVGLRSLGRLGVWSWGRSRF